MIADTVWKNLQAAETDYIKAMVAASGWRAWLFGWERHASRARDNLKYWIQVGSQWAAHGRMGDDMRQRIWAALQAAEATLGGVREEEQSQ